MNDTIVSIKDKRREYHRLWALEKRTKNRDAYNAYQRQYRLTHPYRFEEYRKRIRTPEELAKTKLTSRLWRERNKEHLAEKMRRYRRDHSEIVKAINHRAQKKRNEIRRGNAIWRLEDNYFQFLRRAMRGGSIIEATCSERLGCSQRELISHFESKFEPGMTWANYGQGHGKWCIDHIKPRQSFDFAIPGEINLAFHFTNLRPRWFVNNCGGK